MEGHEQDLRAVDVIYSVAASLDGYIAPADGTLAWLTPFEAFGDDHGYTTFYQSIDAVLLGRHTFEHAATCAQWPYPTKPCWVCLPRRLPVSEPNVVVTACSPRAVVAELASRGMRCVWLVGGRQLAGAFRAQGLITEYLVTVMPMLLGTGMPLFGTPAPTEALHLVASQVTPKGLVQLHYRRTHEA
jgi:dihydrofolate reductase